jgi:undecaprenyl diphosphate synthase
MKQSTSLHVAIVMDGNGRWATRRGLPRAAGHRAGAEAVRRVVEIASDCGITALTVYAFSSDNWSRPTAEVSMLMRLFARYLRTETAELAAKGVRLCVIGRRDRLPHALLDAIAAAEQETKSGTRLELRIAVDYSARTAIERGQLLPDVDLLIRTGGEQRLSDSSSGNARTPSCGSPNGCGPTSALRISRPRSMNSTHATAASAGCRPGRPYDRAPAVSPAARARVSHQARTRDCGGWSRGRHRR